MGNWKPTKARDCPTSPKKEEVEEEEEEG